MSEHDAVRLSHSRTLAVSLSLTVFRYTTLTLTAERHLLSSSLVEVLLELAMSCEGVG
jgi:hypothetical protein